MNVLDRQDRTLVAGLILALIVVFARPIQYLFDMAREVEQNSGLALVPALVILTIVFVWHQQGKRKEARARAARAEADAVQAQVRAQEMEALVDFGQPLGRSLDKEGLREVVLQHLAKLVGSDDAWVVTRFDGHWQPLVGAAHDSRAGIEQQREQIAERALGIDNGGSAAPAIVDGHLCVPMLAGGDPVGMLGVPEAAGPFNEGRRRVLAATAALLAISVRNVQLFREVRENSLRDGLTGCFNRTHAREVIDAELRRARRSRQPVSLIMFDLDYFKEINDRHGHLCGDTVLVSVAARMREVLRGSDVKCRYGGEEFLVLLPETPLEGAKRVADGLRRAMAEMAVQWKDERLSVTASFGVTMAAPSELDTDAVIARADAALYHAKEQGRNCVRLLDAVVPQPV